MIKCKKQDKTAKNVCLTLKYKDLKVLYPLQVH